MSKKKNIMRVTLLMGIIISLFFIQQVYERNQRFDDWINYRNENNLNVSSEYINYFGNQAAPLEEEWNFIFGLSGLIMVAMFFFATSFVPSEENKK